MEMFKTPTNDRQRESILRTIHFAGESPQLPRKYDCRRLTDWQRASLHSVDGNQSKSSTARLIGNSSRCFRAACSQQPQGAPSCKLTHRHRTSRTFKMEKETISCSRYLNSVAAGPQPQREVEILAAAVDVQLLVEKTADVFQISYSNGESASAENRRRSIKWHFVVAVIRLLLF